MTAAPTNVPNINTPAYWDEVYRAEWAEDAILTRRDYGPMHDLIVGLVAAGSRVLDVGCGPGILCRKLAEQVAGVHVTGVDFSAYAVAHNAERDAELGVEYRCVDVRTGLHKVEERFDVVTMCEVLEHLDSPEEVVAAAVALVRPGGLFVLSCPHDGQVPHAEHVREWGHDQVFHLLAGHALAVTFHRVPEPRDRWLLACCTKPRPTLVEQLRDLGLPEYRVVGGRGRKPEEKAAAALGRFTVFRTDVELSPPVDWNQDPFGSRSGVYELHTLQFLDALVCAYFDDGDPKWLEQALALALDWIASNTEDAEGVNPFAWYDMAVGLRAPYLAFVLRACAEAGLVGEADAVTIVASLRGHGGHLAAEENYAHGHNHGLFQDEGLLLLTGYLPFLEESPGWRQLAWTRCMKTLRETVDWDEGVHLEHSPAYHLAATHFVRRIVGLDGADEQELGRLLARLEDTAGWLVLPDGTLPELGDTDSVRAAVWAARSGDGKEGLKLWPRSGLAVVKDAESFLIASAWYHGRGHKHADELGFVLYETGRRVLCDSGRYGYYEEEPARRYARSSHAHNTLLLDGESFDWPSAEPYGSGIAAGGVGAGWYAIEGVNPLLRDAEHRRLFLYRPGQVLIVVDEVKSAELHAVSRFFHFGPDVEVEETAAGLSIRADGLQGAVSDWADGTVGLTLARGQHEPDIRGWTFPRDRQLVPVWTAELGTTGAVHTSATAIALHDEHVRVRGVVRSDATVRVSIDLNRRPIEIAAASRDGTIEIEVEGA